MSLVSRACSTVKEEGIRRKEESIETLTWQVRNKASTNQIPRPLLDISTVLLRLLVLSITLVDLGISGIYRGFNIAVDPFVDDVSINIGDFPSPCYMNYQRVSPFSAGQIILDPSSGC